MPSWRVIDGVHSSQTSIYNLIQFLIENELNLIILVSLCESIQNGSRMRKLERNNSKICCYNYSKMERNNYHKKNVSALGTARTKKTSVDSKSKDKVSVHKSKEKPEDIVLQNKMKKRLSFASPSRKDSNATAKGPITNLSLLNYMIFRENHKDSIPALVSHRLSPLVLTKDQFSVIEILGKGGFGKVYKVEFRKNKSIYAMKEMSKSVILTKNSVPSVMNERKLLSELKHPFLVNMVYAFQDRANLYLIMDYMPGGDLRYQIGKYQKFPQHVLKFFLCCIILSLQYLHDNCIIHRDLKPENLIFDGKGYLRLTDMGVARIDSPNNQQDTSGTPGYMAPEVITREPHSFPVDFFALGVIAYECMLGKRPYRGYNRQEIREQMLLYEASVKPHQLPKDWNPVAIDFINRLLKRKPADRLGTRGIQQLFRHPWLQDIDWGKMLAKKYPSPFMPNLAHRNYDTVSESEYGQHTEEKLAQNSLLLRKNEVQTIFQGYEYNEVKLA